MMHTLLAYLRYRIKSRTKYRVHSPFVFDFMTKGMETPLTKSLVKQTEAFRKALYADNSQLKITDYGAGSKVFRSDIRKVADIAKYAGMSRRKAYLLQKIVQYFQPESILELGTSLGLSAVAMHYAQPKAQIISIEACPQTAAKANSFLKAFNINPIDIRVGRFSELLPEICRNNKFDFIYFDGNHQKEPTLNYFFQAKKCKKNHTLFIFDDIHWSKEMEEAWKIMSQDKAVTLSMDLFYMGIISFRKEQEKQHFILKGYKW